MNMGNFVQDPRVRAWLRTLVDCPPGAVRHGYGLLDAWWAGYGCGHVVCEEALGCVLLYPHACQDVGEALDWLVQVQLVQPVGRSAPATGHTHKASGPDLSRIRAGVPWSQRVHEPAYLYHFTSGDKLDQWLDSANGEEVLL